jgi:hypothetical protein
MMLPPHLFSQKIKERYIKCLLLRTTDHFSTGAGEEEGVDTGEEVDTGAGAEEDTGAGAEVDTGTGMGDRVAAMECAEKVGWEEAPVGGSI